MSDELIDLAAEPTQDPNEPAAPYGTETALGGQTRDQYRAGSPIVAEITKTVEFHLGDNPAAGQILREVFGTIERMVMPGGVVKRPNNRPPELREWPAGAIRQLAALCRVYAPGGDSIQLAVPNLANVDIEVDPEVIAALPDGSLAVVLPDPAEVAAEVARIEEEVNAEPAPLVDVAAVAAEVDRQAREREGGTVETVDPDPFVGPAPILFTDILTDPFSNPFPISAAEWDRARGLDDIPF